MQPEEINQPEAITPAPASESNLNIVVHSSIIGIIGQVERDTLYKFTEFCAEVLPITGPINIKLMPKRHNGTGTTGGFNTQTNHITTRYEGRAIVDVLRTIAHELVHQRQSETGELAKYSYIPDIGGPIEDEANAVAGQIMKRFAKERNARYIYDL